jgi:uncharacterized protein YjiS (DUF1127 family)
MSSLLIGSSAQETFAPAAAGPSWWARLARAVVDEYRARRAIGQLHGMNERLLCDIGLDRGGIEHAVRFGRD